MTQRDMLCQSVYNEFGYGEGDPQRKAATLATEHALGQLMAVSGVYRARTDLRRSRERREMRQRRRAACEAFYSEVKQDPKAYGFAPLFSFLLWPLVSIFFKAIWEKLLDWWQEGGTKSALIAGAMRGE